MMNKIKVEITRVVTKTMPTRFWGAYNEINGLECKDYMATSGLNTTNQNTFCAKFNLDVDNLENISTLVTASYGNATAKNEIMNGFWDKTTQQGFNISELQFEYMYTNSKAFPLNFGTTIGDTLSLAAVEFKCKSNITCTTEELFEKQFLAGTISY